MASLDKVLDLVRHPDLLMKEKPSPSLNAKLIKEFNFCGLVSVGSSQQTEANSLMLASSCSGPPTLDATPQR